MPLYLIMQERSGLLASDLLHTVLPPIYDDKLQRDLGVIVEKLRAKQFFEEDFCLLEDLIGALSDSSPYKELILEVPSTRFEICRVQGSVDAGDVQRCVAFRCSPGILSFEDDLGQQTFLWWLQSS